MNESFVQTTTGIVGIVMFILTMLEIYLYFVYSGPPPTQNILIRVFIDLFICIGLIVFSAGFRHIILRTYPDYELLGTLCLVWGLTYSLLTFAANSIQVGSILGKKEPIDPTLVGSGGEGALLIYGPIARLITAAFLASAGSVIIISGFLPAWLGWLAYFVGIFNLALVPSIFYKTEPAFFYSINGWGIPVAGGLFLTWILLVSIWLIWQIG